MAHGWSGRAAGQMAELAKQIAAGSQLRRGSVPYFDRTSSISGDGTLGSRPLAHGPRRFCRRVSVKLFVVTENKDHPAPGGRDTIEFSERSKGVQVIQTAGLPEGYVPPSAALVTPVAQSAVAPATPPGNGTGSSAGSGATGNGAGGGVGGNVGQP